MKKLPKSQVEFELEISSEEVAVFFDKAASEVSNHVDIKGFRKGKIPRDVLEKTVGKQLIFEEAGKFAVEKKYSDFIRENNLFVIDNPHIEVKKLAEGNPVLAAVVVAVYPEVKIADYKKVASVETQKRKKDITFEEKELSDALAYIQNSRAKEVAVLREAKEGDLAEVDFEARLGGVKIEGGESKNHPVKIGEKKFIPGFEDQIKGMKVGEEKDFTLLVPESYFQKSLAGKNLDFHVKLNNLFEVILPELNDEFAKSVGNFESLDALKKNIEDGIKKEKEQNEKESFRNGLLDKISAESEIDLPDVMVERELDKMIAEFEGSISQYGADFNSYLANIKKTEESLRADFRNQAEKRIKAALVLAEIIKKENIQAEETELTEKANEMLAKFQDMETASKSIDPERLKEYARTILLNEKAFTLLENFN